MEVKVIGSLESKFESTARIYDVGGCSPTLSTMQGGNREPKILEVKQLGFMDNGTGKHQSNTVYDENGISPNITTINGGGTQQIKICVENKIAAMRGRNSNNLKSKSDRKSTEQKLEVNSNGTSNCLTSVQKDNLVIETSVLTPKRTPYGKAIRKAYESGKINESRHNMTELEPRKDAISNTLTTVQKDNLLLESMVINDRGFKEKIPKVKINESPTLRAESHGNIPKVMIKQSTKSGIVECDVGGVFDAAYPHSKTRRGRVQENGNISPTLTSQNQEILRIEKQYRIRKLTPLECFRLMGCSDEDANKMLSVNSNTQCYKQAGNSIVVDVMCAMFMNLNICQE